MTRLGCAARAVRAESGPGAKPAGLGPEYAAPFGDPSVVAAYGARPPYPEALGALVVGLAGEARPRILDLGCGTGELARSLALSGF